MRHLMLLLLLAGCGKKVSEAITELGPAYAEARAKLKRLESVTGGDENGKLTGSIYTDDSMVVNMSMLMAEKFHDPDVEVRRGDSAYIKTFDPVAGGALDLCLVWTGPNNPMSSSAMSDHDGERILKLCDLKRLRTVVRVKTVASIVPELREDGKFTGGQALLEVTAIDWASEKPVARFMIEGVPDQVVKYEVRGGESKAVEAALSVHSSMWMDARKKLFAALKDRGADIRKQ